MVCPFCTQNKTIVYNSRKTKKLNNVWRRRRCLTCNQEFTTIEYVDPASVIGIANDKKSQPYSRSKLLVSLIRALDHRNDVDKAANYLLATVEQRLYGIAAKHAKHQVDKQLVIDNVAKTLKNFDTAAYVKYLSYYGPTLNAKELKKRL